MAATGKKWKTQCVTVIVCTGWLTKAGLNAEPGRTELLFFRKKGEKSEPPPYTHPPH